MAEKEAELRSVVAHIAQLEYNERRLKAHLDETRQELTARRKRRQELCPHQKVVETREFYAGACGDCDGRSPDHAAGICEICGLYEEGCGFYFDGFYRLQNKGNRIVGGDEFKRIYLEFHKG